MAPNAICELSCVTQFEGYVQLGPPPRPTYKAQIQTWFQLCKYFIAIKNGISLILVTSIGIILVLSMLNGLFDKNSNTDSASNQSLTSMFFSTLILVTLALYIYFVPIRGALKENFNLLIVHGSVQALWFICALCMIELKRWTTTTTTTTTTTAVVQTKNEGEGHFVRQVTHHKWMDFTSTDFAVSSLLLSGLDLVPIFLVVNNGQYYHRRRRHHNHHNHRHNQGSTIGVLNF